jgi:hypothetical protein
VEEMLETVKKVLNLVANDQEIADDIALFCANIRCSLYAQDFTREEANAIIVAAIGRK